MTFAMNYYNKICNNWRQKAVKTIFVALICLNITLLINFNQFKYNLHKHKFYVKYIKFKTFLYFCYLTNWKKF